MFDIKSFSARYTVRLMKDSDADEIFDLCLKNTQYYQYCGKRPSRELVLNDMHITPPGINKSFKYYVGFYDNTVLTAVMDLIDGYPDAATAYIGFFMVKKELQGKQIGTGIIREVCGYLKEVGVTRVRLGIDKGNPESNHFWKKNGFIIIKEVEQDAGTVLLAEKVL